MTLLERIQLDMVAAMKAKQEARLSATRLIKSALQKEQADSAQPLDEAGEMRVMNRLINQRRESATMFRQAGREEQAAKEEAELALIESYLPAAPSDAELEAAIDAAIAQTAATSSKQMGAVIKATQAALTGKRVDGKLLSDRVKAKLGA